MIRQVLTVSCPGPDGDHRRHCPSVSLRVIVALLCLLLAAHSAFAEALMLCVHPYRVAAEIQERFKPLAAYLTRKLGKPVHLHIPKDYREHIRLIGQGNMDIAFMGPVPYVLLTETYGKREVIARLESNGKPSIAGVIFVPLKSQVRTLQDLKGKRFAYGSPESTMSHLVPAYLLMQAGVTNRQLASHSFLSNHDNVILGVLMNDFDAGAVMEDVFLEKRSMGIRRIARTPEMPEHLFVAGKHLSRSLVKEVRTALFRMKDDAEGREALRAIRPSITGIAAAEDRDYDCLRTILRELKAGGVMF